MNMSEYQQVKGFTYLEYCDYLQAKYGIGRADYMTKSYNPNPKCKRTKDGLVAHHKKEDTMVMLATKEVAQLCPFEWQSKENIVYCDYLEHLLLHVLICKYPANNKPDFVCAGIGGVVNFITPELNDLYSGWTTNQAWRKNCHNRVLEDKDVYLAILKQFIDVEKSNPNFEINMLCRSYNQQYGLWDDEKNEDLYAKIKELNKTQRDALKKFEGTLKEENYEKRKGFFKRLKDMFA